MTIHEAGHQWWYGIVGSNEFEHAWMDEGLNTFATARVIERGVRAELPRRCATSAASSRGSFRDIRVHARSTTTG